MMNDQTPLQKPEAPAVMTVRNALTGIINPATGRSVIAEGRIAGLSVNDGVARFTFEAREEPAGEANSLLQAAIAAVRAVDGITDVKAVGTRHQTAPAPPPRKDPADGHANPMGLPGATGAKPGSQMEKAAEALNGVARVVAVASGKGGVGKSTITWLLAQAASARGLRVGLLDADIYGPSLPTFLGITDKPPLYEGKIVPYEVDGIKVMSIGFLVDPEQALAWRGPMVMGAVRQLMGDVLWGTLDLLLIDTPPGTGDAHLSLIQSGRLDGAVIVTTPHRLAAADVRRGAALFTKTKIPVLGLVENMSWMAMPDGTRVEPFGPSEADGLAETINAPVLARLPLEPAVGTQGSARQTETYGALEPLIDTLMADGAARNQD